MYKIQQDYFNYSMTYQPQPDDELISQTFQQYSFPSTRRFSTDSSICEQQEPLTPTTPTSPRKSSHRRSRGLSMDSFTLPENKQITAEFKSNVDHYNYNTSKLNDLSDVNKPSTPIKMIDLSEVNKPLTPTAEKSKVILPNFIYQRSGSVTTMMEVEEEEDWGCLDCDGKTDILGFLKQPYDEKLVEIVRLEISK